MRKLLQPAVSILIIVLIGSAFSACELINPDEQTPSFLKIDSISLATTASEGPADHNIVDAWVFNNEQLVGIFELPAIVPILSEGEANIRIRGGIKLNGQVGTRIPYLYTQDYTGTLELFPDSQVRLNPTISFHDDINFPWIEDLKVLDWHYPKQQLAMEDWKGLTMKMRLMASRLNCLFPKAN